jgi:hypothetical protein
MCGRVYAIHTCTSIFAIQLAFIHLKYVLISLFIGINRYMYKVVNQFAQLLTNVPYLHVLKHMCEYAHACAAIAQSLAVFGPFHALANSWCL